jgi:hypothetical protein
MGIAAACRGEMGIAGVSGAYRPGFEPRFRFEKPALFLSDPRADVSEHGGPGLPGARDRTTPSERAYSAEEKPSRFRASRPR